LGLGLLAAGVLVGQDDPELDRLKALNALMDQQIKQLQNQLTLQGLQSPGPLQQLKDQNDLLAEQLKATTNARAIAAAQAPPNSQLQQLTDQNALLDQQAKLAASLQTLAGASVPKFTGGLDGATTLAGDASVESVHLAYQALATAATSMAKDIQHCGSNDRIMFFNAAEVAALDNLNAFRLQSRLLNDLLIQTLRLDASTQKSANAPALSAVPLGLLMVGPIIQSLIDFTKLFRVNREITVKDLQADDKAFLSILATKLRAIGHHCELYYPDLIPAKPFEELRLPGSSVPSDLDQIGKLTAYLDGLGDQSGPAPFADWLTRIFDKTAILRIRVLIRVDEKAKLDQEIEKSVPVVKKWLELVNSIPSLRKASATADAKLKKLKGELDALQQSSPPDRPGIAKKKKEIDAAQADLEAKQKDVVDAEAAKLDPTSAAEQNKLLVNQQYSAQLAELLKALNSALDAGTAFRTELLKGDGSGVAQLSRLSRTQRLEDRLKFSCGQGCYSSILHISVQKLSAATLKKTGTFTGTQHTFSGGAIATYLQFGVWQSGQPLNGVLSGQGTFSGYSGWHKPGDETPLPPLAGGKL
jgi:hypothetical protein